MAGDDVAQRLAAIGPRLRVVRERRGVTLADASRTTAISPSPLSRIETGRRKPTLEVVLQLAKEFAVSWTSWSVPQPLLRSSPAARRSEALMAPVVPIARHNTVFGRDRSWRTRVGN